MQSPAQAPQPVNALALAALGIVFGDIATSPLYALQEAFGPHGVPPEPANVLGVLSLAFWSLIGVVSLKYIVFIMRADNHGEGGIMALLALAQAALASRPALRRAAVVTGLLGAALFFGDSVITPAISVLSAMEGLRVAAPALSDWVVPASVAVVCVLFALQRWGSARMGRVFGPAMLAWLLAIGALGVHAMVEAPQVLAALDPRHGLSFFLRNGFAGFATLGAVVLVLTGAEALYADMGHFGRRPIRRAWFFVALPCLLASYFGQGALLLANPSAASAPFYRMVPEALLYPMIALAATATVIASQAVICGAYSMIHEATALGFLPRLRVIHNSSTLRGQVYLPAVGAILLVLVIASVVGFGSSSALAASFGIAVSGTMLMTTLLALVVARLQWRWPLPVVLALGAVLLVVDLAFLGANLLKFANGGWFPLLLAAVAYAIATTWRRGRASLSARLRAGGAPLDSTLASLDAHPPQRVEGSAVFLTHAPDATPMALLHNLKHNQVLHACNVVLRVEVLDVPRVAAGERMRHVALPAGFHRIDARYGFAERPDLPALLEDAAGRFDLPLDPMRTTYFTSREHVRPSDRSGMARWRHHLFAALARNALPVSDHFGIPDNRLIELGRRVAV